MNKLGNYKGLLFGVIVGVAWGLDTVLMGLLSSTNSVLSNASTGTSLVVAFLHDGFCFVWLTLVMLFLGKFGSTFKLLKTKKGRAVCLAALVGGPIGMSGFVLGIRYAAPAYASAISVVYPGVGAIMAYFILKEKIPFKAIIGIVVSICGAVALGYSKADLTAYPQFYLGIALACLAVIGWASEGIILAFAMKKIKTEEHIEVKPEQFLTLRYLTSFAVYGFVIMPIFNGYGTVVQLAPTTFLSFAGIAILGVITYLSWYKAVDYVGAGLGTALNSTASFWALLFSWLILRTPITSYLAVCSVVIIVGVFIFALSAYGKKENT